jgi:hypothetical protein
MLAKNHLVPEATPPLTLRTGTAATVEGRDAGVLRAILRPDVNLAVWHRTLDGTLAQDAVLLSESRFKGIDVVVAPDATQLVGVLAPLCAFPGGQLMRADVSFLFGAFAQLFPGPVRLCLERVTGDHCAKFHVDYLRARLITTYVGPGTEWLPEANVNRDVLHHPPDCPCDANAQIARPGTRPRQASAGDVLLMNGERNDDGLPALVHRSPSLGSIFGGVRIVLALSTVGDG